MLLQAVVPPGVLGTSMLLQATLRSCKLPPCNQSLHAHAGIILEAGLPPAGSCGKPPLDLCPQTKHAFEYMQPGFVLVVMPPAAGVMHAVRQGYLKNMYFGIAQDAAATHLLEVCTPKDAARAFSTGHHNIAACAGLGLCTQAVGQLCQCEASHACS